MPAGDEYAVSGAGKLKLKGSKVGEGSRVEKKKKKKKQPQQQQQHEEEGAGDSTPIETTSNTSGVHDGDGAGDDEAALLSPPKQHDDDDRNDEDASVSPAAAGVGKTEAERKYEEVRRKRRLERLKREGIKSHKERVEELNKYLSRLSEHHDMPRIGPG